jgi:hypothetical protein
MPIHQSCFESCASDIEKDATGFSDKRGQTTVEVINIPLDRTGQRLVYAGDEVMGTGNQVLYYTLHLSFALDTLNHAPHEMQFRRNLCVRTVSVADEIGTEPELPEVEAQKYKVDVSVRFNVEIIPERDISQLVEVRLNHLDKQSAPQTRRDDFLSEEISCRLGRKAEPYVGKPLCAGGCGVNPWSLSDRPTAPVIQSLASQIPQGAQTEFL